MADTLQCPTPFLVGMHSSMTTTVETDLDTIDALHIIDVDADRIWHVGKGTLQSAPSRMKDDVRSRLLIQLRLAAFGQHIVRLDERLPVPTADISIGPLVASAIRQAVLQGAEAFVTLLPKSNIRLFDAKRFLVAKNDFAKSVVLSAAFNAYVGTLSLSL